MKFIFCVIALAALVVVAVGIDTRALTASSLAINDAVSTSADPTTGFVAMALSFLRTGTFNNNAIGYIGQGQRGPVLPIVTAAFFLVFGYFVWVLYAMNFIIFVLAIVALFSLAKNFLTGWWAKVPPVMLALFAPWGVQVYGSYEPFNLLLLLGSLVFLFWWREHKSPWYLAGAFVSFSLLALEKPVFLYFVPILVVWIFFYRQKLPAMKFLIPILFIPVVLLGAWALRNDWVLGTWQFGSGGHVLLRASQQTMFTKDHLKSLTLSYLFGDLVASKIDAHYPPDGEVPQWDPSVEDRWYGTSWVVRDLDGEMLTRTELDQKMYREAVTNITAHPVLFFETGFIRLLRLNAPLYHRNRLEITHLFMGEPNVAFGLKIAFILFIRVLWFLFLIGVVVGMVARYKEYLLIFLVLYYNATHALLTHAEGRYALLIIPLYFIFFTVGLEWFLAFLRLSKASFRMEAK